MNEKRMMQNLMKRLKEYDEKYVRVRDVEKIKWFYNEALPCLKILADVHTCMNYVENEHGIIVNIITDGLLLLPEMGDEGVRILCRADECKVKALDSKIHISLYFATWLDVERAQV